MRLFSNSGGKHLNETDCIGISASPENLRAIASFLTSSADELEEMGSEFDHRHLMDEWESWQNGFPDIQVFNTKK